MNNEDYIRIKKAVGLADGWKIDPNGIWPPFPFPAYADIKDTQPIILDALAAQLVRQVDSLDKYVVHAFSTRTAVRTSGPLMDIADAKGPDRTMNTIKAIIDSKVLKAAQEHGDSDE